MEYDDILLERILNWCIKEVINYQGEQDNYKNLNGTTDVNHSYTNESKIDNVWCVLIVWYYQLYLILLSIISTAHKYYNQILSIIMNTTQLFWKVCTSPCLFSWLSCKHFVRGCRWYIEFMFALTGNRSK